MCFPFYLGCSASGKSDVITKSGVPVPSSSRRFFRTRKRPFRSHKKSSHSNWYRNSDENQNTSINRNLLATNWWEDGEMVRARVNEVFDGNRATLTFFPTNGINADESTNTWIHNCVLIGVPPDPAATEWLTKRLQDKVVWVECGCVPGFYVTLYTDSRFMTSVNEEVVTFLLRSKDGTGTIETSATSCGC